MYLFCLENLASHEVKPVEIELVASRENPRPPNLEKESFRSWCTSASTKSTFFSTWSGADERIRVSSSNPAFKLHGIVGDYDSSAAYHRLEDLPKTTGVLPMWSTKTFSEGKARLIWIFERPVIINNEEVLKRFLKALDRRIKFSKALPGFDSASIDASQYFELGDTWQRVPGATVVPEALLEHAMVESAERFVFNTNDLPIPINTIAEQAAERFPGRWNKPFEVGVRGPLFWIADGIDREGAIVTDNGMLCFSDRAGTNFMSWRQIFGNSFVEGYEDQIIGQTSLTFYFDGRVYYRKLGGKWNAVQKDDARLQLKSLGVSDMRRKGQSTTDLEKVLNHIQTQRRIDGAAPIAYREEEVVDVSGRKILNTGCLRAMQPAPVGEGDPAKFPWLNNWFENAFDEGVPGVSAKDNFLGWFYWFYKSALELNLQLGQIMIMVGPKSTGKSFINKWVIGKALGGSFDAEETLVKQNVFNRGAAEFAHWRIDDAVFKGNPQEKRAFTQALKRHAANPTINYQPKFVDSQEIPHLGRVMMTINPDSESLAIIPTLDNSFEDKVIMHYLRSDFKPHFFSTLQENEDRAMQELPYFLRWLLDVWGKNGLPDGVRDEQTPRFGVKAYHHPTLVEKSHAETPEYMVQELLDVWATGKAKDSNAATQYTASELLQELRGALPDMARDINARGFGRMLSKLVGQYTKLVDKKTTNGISRYVFDFTK